jgi:hypothetical protein
MVSPQRFSVTGAGEQFKLAALVVWVMSVL